MVLYGTPFASRHAILRHAPCRDAGALTTVPGPNSKLLPGTPPAPVERYPSRSYSFSSLLDPSDRISAALAWVGIAVQGRGSWELGRPVWGRLCYLATLTASPRASRDGKGEGLG